MRRIVILQKRIAILITVAVIVTICLFLRTQNLQPFRIKYEYIVIGDKYDDDADSTVQKWMELRQNEKNLSKLGRILFLGEEEPAISSDKTFQILVWKYGPTIESRHLKRFSNERIDPFSYCPVNNCDITYEDSAISTADIVIFPMHRMKSTKELPKGKRNPSQIWAFLTDESPHHTIMTPRLKLTDFDGVFNWSMTYRMDSDIPVPYGRTVVRKYPKQFELNLNKRRDVLVAILGSHCFGRSHRWEYVKALQKHIEIDVYGNCGPLHSCPGHFKLDCPDIDNYLFYLAFENSNCNDYITEKLWWNAFQKNSIPIVMGAKLSNCKMLLPPNSYIHIDDFASPAVLAQYIKRLNETGEFRDFFQWKRNFEVLNEHGYFQSKSFHYCRVCQALNYNDKKQKTYRNLKDFWSPQRDCYPAWDA
ncbi:glycoprotein 3-alpha-L-fucosyltransferase A [Leptinotarsa decemlineata]|uniref:glycoprotein 3-alpha-L-fucosyltransferase A n=1 Tax=Leptinotarsa decemlineata TaxID=7539 RepID=UPI003D30AB36